MLKKRRRVSHNNWSDAGQPRKVRDVVRASDRPRGSLNLPVGFPVIPPPIPLFSEILQFFFLEMAAEDEQTRLAQNKRPHSEVDANDDGTSTSS